MVTPERVSLEYGIAGIGSRCAAVVVDTVIQGVAISVLAIGLMAAVVAIASIPGSDGGGSGAFGLLIGLIALGVFVVTTGYFMFFEILWNGQTPGKRLLGLRVIRENGYPLRPLDAVIRELLRIVDFLPGFYAAGVLTMLLNKRSKRLGDFAAGTIVVREGARRSFSAVTFSSGSSASAAFTSGSSASAAFTSASDGPDSMEPPAVTLAAADATLVRDFLLRRAGMHPKARAELARRLAAAVRERYYLPVDSGSDPEQFLERLTV